MHSNHVLHISSNMGYCCVKGVESRMTCQSQAVVHARLRKDKQQQLILHSFTLTHTCDVSKTFFQGYKHLVLSPFPHFPTLTCLTDKHTHTLTVIINMQPRCLCLLSVIDSVSVKGTLRLLGGKASNSYFFM